MLKALKILQIIKGGPGSGNWGHVGRVGHRGGSQSNKKVMSLSSGPTAKKRYQQAKNVRAPLSSKIRGKTGQALDPKNIPSFDKLNSLIVTNEITFGAVHLEPAVMGEDKKLEITTNIGHNERGKIKDNLVTNLANRTNMPYFMVNRVIKGWSYSSNDNDMRALNMQEAAAELFGTKLSDWQKERIAETKKNKSGAELSSNFDSYDPKQGKYDLDPDLKKLGYKTSREAEKAFLKAMYEETQKAFKEQGITEVVIHRGIRIKDEKYKSSIKKGSAARLDNSNALESWSISKDVASEFAHGSYGYSENAFVLTMKVPVERILSTAGTGYGCSNEHEVILIGGQNDEVYIE